MRLFFCVLVQQELKFIRTGLLFPVKPKADRTGLLNVLIQQVMQADGTSLDVDMKSEKLIAVQRTTCPTKATTLNLKKKVTL
jgi:hypothetical protein